MALVSLTVDGSSFSLEESDVVKVYELSSEVKVEYLIEKLGITKTVVVAESVSTINGLSDLLISLTDTVSGSTFLLNSNRVSDVFTEGTGAKINYDVANFTQSVVVDESVSAVAALYPSYEPSVSYKVYRALVTQSGTNAPTVTVLENTLGGTVIWSYTGVGDYLATLAGAFPDIDKVFMMSDTPINVPGSTYSLYWNDANSIGYGTGDKDGIAGNGRLYKTSLEIRVYD